MTATKSKSNTGLLSVAVNLNKNMKTKKIPEFKNKHGLIPVGTRVKFNVENQDQWGGDLTGILILDGNEFKIKTERSGCLTINKGYDVYFNTIEPL